MNATELQDQRNEYFMKLYEPHHPSALAYARRLAGNVEDGRDLLQESLEAALRGFGSLRRADSFKPWFFRVVRNRHLNRARSTKLAERFKFDFQPRVTQPPDYRTIEREKLIGALDELTPVERETVVLYEVEGFLIRDIARIQRCSVATIKYRLRQGRNKLRAAYFSDFTPPASNTIPARDE
jgi:RNA polymerase sigma-70 factor (ECF subfamily)